MARDLYYGEDARTRLQNGMDQLADAVKTTIGAQGRNVLVSGIGGKPVITNEASGVTRDFELGDISENLGAQMLTEVASKIKDEVGDGTTTAILLTQAIICEGIKNMAAGADPMGLRRGIHGAVDAAVQSIRESAYQLEKKRISCRLRLFQAQTRKLEKCWAILWSRSDGTVSLPWRSPRP